MRDLFGGDDKQFAILDDARRGGARAIVDDRHLADDLAAPAGRQNDVLAVARKEYFEASSGDQIGARACVAFAKQQSAGGKRNPVKRGVHAMPIPLSARSPCKSSHAKS